MSTSYQIVFGNKNKDPDPERNFRFTEKRQLEQQSQSEWMYCIFKESIYARIKAMAILVAIYSTYSVVIY